MKYLTFFALLTLVLVPQAFAADISVAAGVITTQVVDRTPVDEIESYPAQQGTLFCFTKIVGAETDTEVSHVWLYQDKEMARVTLPARSSSWRTQSSKKILPEWSGDWKVQVLDAEGQELAIIPFKLL